MQFRHKLKDLEGISTTIYTTQAPSPTLFVVLSQGQSRVGIQQLIIIANCAARDTTETWDSLPWRVPIGS
jgi:hypothetical protein